MYTFPFSSWTSFILFKLPPTAAPLPPPPPPTEIQTHTHTHFNLVARFVFRVAVHNASWFNFQSRWMSSCYNSSSMDIYIYISSKMDERETERQTKRVTDRDTIRETQREGQTMSKFQCKLAQWEAFSGITYIL